MLRNSLGRCRAHSAGVGLLLVVEELPFSQNTEGLKIQLPQQDPGDGPYTLRIAGLKLP